MPLTYQDLVPFSAHANVFTPGGQIATPRLLLALLEKWGEVFSGEPLTFPTNIFGMDPPQDAPRIILQSADQSTRLVVTGASTGLHWQAAPNAASYHAEEFVDLASATLIHFLEVAPARAGRLSMQIQRAAPAEQPAQTLVDHFCDQRLASGLLSNLDNFELNAHKFFQMSDEFRVNSWVRCKSGDVSVQGEAVSPTGLQRSIVVEQDINTPAEVAMEIAFSPEQIDDFFGKASRQLDKTLQEYFSTNE